MIGRADADLSDSFVLDILNTAMCRINTAMGLDDCPEHEMGEHVPHADYLMAYACRCLAVAAQKEMSGDNPHHMLFAAKVAVHHAIKRLGSPA